MRNRLTKTCCAALLILTVGCGGQQERPDLPEGFDDSTLVDTPEGKSDWLTKWYTTVQGPVAFGSAIMANTSSSEWFHGYTFELKPGDKISATAYGHDWGMLRLYGPRKCNGKWGKARRAAWIRPDYGTQGDYKGTLYAFSATTAGTYLLVVGSPWDSPYKYDLHLSCESGQCGPSFCVEYETTDEAGTPYNNFYAINVKSYAEGKQKLAYAQHFINEAINTGACDTQLVACPKVYMPVCGNSPGTLLKTWGNVCQFKSFVRTNAGSTGESKGHWDSGVCAVCTYNGKDYNIGETFPSLDGCNTCTCTSTGAVSCTEKACICNPTKEWWRSYYSTDVFKCGTIKFACPAYTDYFSNSCGCGCEQDASCPEWINCMPPIDCSKQKTQCPYSKIAY